MPRHAHAVLIIVLAIGAYGSSGGANGVPAPAPSRNAPRTPETMAVEAYNKGLESRNRGIKAEEQAAKSVKDSDRLRHDKRAKDEYKRAAALFTEATAKNPELPQAWNGIGFIHRKLGEYDRSLAAYERALTLAPNFPDAIEYRGETYLAMNRIEDAKQAYLTLFGLDRQQAELLMKAMAGWVAQRRAAPQDVDPSAIADLERWIKERAAVAQQTRRMAPDVAHRGW